MFELWPVLADYPLGYPAGLGVLGLLVGSFLNVVIHRLPLMMERDWRRDCADLAGHAETDSPVAAFNLMVPRSRCPHCQQPIAAWDNLPVLSWLLLAGRCRHCRASISVRYPLVELSAAVLGVVAAWHFGATPSALWGAGFSWALLALAVIDLDTQLLPDDLTLPLLWAGLVANLFGYFVDLPTAVVGAMAGYLSLWVVYWGFKFATGKEGMGYGDFKLLAALGAWLGWQALPTIIVGAALVGAVVGLALIGLRRHERSKPLPFGPFLAAAGWINLIWGAPLRQLIGP